MKMITMVKSTILFFIPHFITEDVAVQLTADGYLPVISMDAVEGGEVFDGVVTMRSIAFLFWAFPFGTVGDVRAWEHLK